MKHLDTFSGIGGWALAARWMGWETVAFVEKDKFCGKVLNKNFPGVPVHDDIFTFSGKPFRDRVDILTGSTPCQPFSQAGKREGSNDERHLFPEFLRVVAECRPRWIIVENVYGLLSIESGQVFEDYHTSLESEGYSVQTLCIPASALNAPHRRDRLWIVANSFGRGRGTDGITGRLERIQRERKDNTMPLEKSDTHGFLTNTLDGKHRAERRPERKAESVSGIGRSQGLSGRVGGATGDAADTAATRLQRGRYLGRHQTIFSKDRTEYDDCDVTTDHPLANSERERLQGDESGDEAERFNRLRDRIGRSEGGYWAIDWTEVAAEFCRVDDVVPNRVDRLKSLGNAIVPQIAYEIFKAIDEVENLS